MKPGLQARVQFSIIVTNCLPAALASAALHCCLAGLQVLLASLGEPFKRGAGGLCKLSARGSSSSSPRAGNSPRQQSPRAAAGATASSNTSMPTVLSPHVYAAAAASAGLMRGKSGSGSSNGSLVSSSETAAVAAQAAATSPRGATTVTAGTSTARGVAAYMAELPMVHTEQPPVQQRQRQSMDLPSTAAPVAEPPRSLSGWLEGENSLAHRQQQQQQVLAQQAAAGRSQQQQQQQHMPAVGSNPGSGNLPPSPHNSHLPPQSPLQHVSGSNGSCMTAGSSAF